MKFSTYISHPHMPPHLFVPNAMYMVTGSVYGKKRLINSSRKLSYFCDILKERTLLEGWILEAWAVFENHYHFISRAPKSAMTLTSLIRSIHSLTARFINTVDNTSGRRVWQNCWDSCIRTEVAYYAGLHYVIMNPVKHGLVSNPEDYPYSGYKWFVDTAGVGIRETVLNQSSDRINFQYEFFD